MSEGVGAGQLARLTAAKGAANLGVRWVPFFLPTLAAAFSATTRQLTVALGLSEMAGLAALALGRQLDRGRERLTLIASMGLVAAGSLLSLTGRFDAFAIGFFITLLGANLCTVSGHVYLSRRVGFGRRARAIGLFETSWALSLLIGAPIAALLIAWFGWRGPFVLVAASSIALGLLVAVRPDDSTVLPDANGPVERVRLEKQAWLSIFASAAIAVTGLTTIVITGTWLDEDLGVSTGGIGLVAMAFGLAELVASSSSAAVADRVGPNRATRFALMVTVVGLAVMVQAGSSLLIGSLGLLLFFLGFEFAIVTSFAIVSEAMPAARGRVLATNVAVGTVLRGAAVTASGSLFETFGITGPAAVSAVGGVVAIALLTAVARR